MAGGATTLSITTLAIMAVLLCRVSVMLSVTYKNFMLSVIMVSSIMLIVVVPVRGLHIDSHCKVLHLDKLWHC
jgi:hypothetical protein